MGSYPPGKKPKDNQEGSIYDQQHTSPLFCLIPRPARCCYLLPCIFNNRCQDMKLSYARLSYPHSRRTTDLFLDDWRNEQPSPPVKIQIYLYIPRRVIITLRC